MMIRIRTRIEREMVMDISKLVWLIKCTRRYKSLQESELGFYHIEILLVDVVRIIEAPG